MLYFQAPYTLHKTVAFTNTVILALILILKRYLHANFIALLI